MFPLLALLLFTKGWKTLVLVSGGLPCHNGSVGIEKKKKRKRLTFGCLPVAEESLPKFPNHTLLQTAIRVPRECIVLYPHCLLLNTP